MQQYVDCGYVFGLVCMRQSVCTCVAVCMRQAVRMCVAVCVRQSVCMFMWQCGCGNGWLHMCVCVCVCVCGSAVQCEVRCGAAKCAVQPNFRQRMHVYVGGSVCAAVSGYACGPLCMRQSVCRCVAVCMCVCACVCGSA
jgi:hypothetical protein